MNLFQVNRFLSFIKYNIQRPYRNDRCIHYPFLLAFINNVFNTKERKNKIISEIETVRRQLGQSASLIKIEDFGAGSVKQPAPNRKIKDIVRISSSPHKYGLLLHHIVRYTKPSIIIELGTCLGFGTMYLASGNATSKVITIEGSRLLLDLAKNNFTDLKYTNIFTRQGNFDDILPVILKENGKFDVLYIDGNHRKDAVLRYFIMAFPYAHNNSIIIVDDIRWSEDMFTAWRELCCNKNVKLSLDLFKMGIIFFNQNLHKQHFKLYY